MEHSNGHSPHPEHPEFLNDSEAAMPVGAAATSEATSVDALAGLVGLEATPTDTASPASSPTTPSAGTGADLLDEEDLEDRDDDGGKSDKTGKTKTPLWANPIVKVVFVAGVAGSAFLAVALVFGALQTAGQRDLAPDIVVAEEEAEAEVDPIEAALQRQQEEIGQLKTQNALGTQQQAMALQAERELDPAEVLALRNRQLDVVETLQERADEAEATEPPPASTSSPPPTPPPTPRPTTVTRPPTARPVPTPTPQPAVVPPVPQRAAPPPVEAVDPQERWDTLVALGSYGQGSYVAEVPAASGEAVVAAVPSDASSVSTAPTPEVTPDAEIPSFSAQAPPAPLPEAEVLELTEPLKRDDATYAQEEAALLGYTLKTVQSGTFAAARLVTPIYWAQDLANEQQPQRTALELIEPLYADDGSIALAEGTLLVAEVMVIAGSGLLELSVTDVVTLEDGVQRTMQLPHQNMVIAGSDGNPLIAREIESDGGIRMAEMQLAALGALGNVGELLNRPDSSTTVIGGDTSISTVENGSVNVLAGLLQGAVDAVLPIEQARIENRIDDINDRPRIWFHDAEAEVLVFVADEFIFRLD